MAENEIVNENTVEVPVENPVDESVVIDESVETATVDSSETSEKKPNVFKRVWAAVKEYGRKFIVKLKRRPMNIGLFVLLVSSILILCSLGNLSQLGLCSQYQTQYQGLCVFIDILFGILVLVLYLNAFPKRSKHPKWVMYALTIVFMLILIGLDLYLYIIWGKNRAADLIRAPGDDNYWNIDPGINKFFFKAVNSVLAHAILVMISMLLMVLSPVIGKLLNKINTKVVLEDTQLKDEIDVEED